MPRRINPRFVFRVALASLLIYLLFCATAGIFLAETVLHPPRHPLTSADEAQGAVWAKEDDSSLSPVTITASDGASLRAWQLQPDEPNGDAVILLHGLRGNRLEMVNYSDIFLNHGYGVLMPDARAHGLSDGSLATYGFLERNDIHLWVEWLIANRHPRCVYGFAESMGAAQLLQSLQSETRFCAVAVEGSFSTFRETSYDRMGQRFHASSWVGRTILWPVVESAFIYVRLRYGLDMDRVSPEDAVAATHVPVLLIHGQSDVNIPIRHSRRMAARNPSVVLWEIPNTGHSNAIDTSPKQLESHVITWFASHH